MIIKNWAVAHAASQPWANTPYDQPVFNKNQRQGGNMKKWIARLLCCLLLICAFPPISSSTGAEKMSAEKTAPVWKNVPDPTLSSTDPELHEIYQNLIAGEIMPGKGLDGRHKMFVTLAALVAQKALADLERNVEVALDAGLSPLEIRETVYQIAPYVGLAAAAGALEKANAVFRMRNINLPLEPQGTVSRESRFKDGLALQQQIFGKDLIEKMQQNAPQGQKELIVNHLSAWCFGDFYTRKTLDLKIRELVTFTAIVALGGCDPQARAHAQANISVGNSKQDLVDALVTVLPWLGFPRTLNGLAAVNAAIPEK